MKTVPQRIAATLNVRESQVAATLKLLEEPPAGTVIILVTTREDRLLPTIRSRCQRVAFAPLDDQAMQSWLASADLAVDPESRRWIERFAEGSPDDLPPGRREKYDQSGRRSKVLVKRLKP